MKYKRIFTIVLDSVGAGEALDAKEFNDLGADTLGHIAESVDHLHIPNLVNLGLANLHPLKNVSPSQSPSAYYTKLYELSNGKDTMTGHWELMGLKISTPFQTFTDTGFPDDLIHALEKETGHGILGNKSSSGTVILDELGEEHIRTNKMIVYTSADSVLQIAAHETYFGLEELYRCCEIARKLTMEPKWKVGRVIARPFIGEKAGEFKRSSNRHDYALKPFGKTVLDALKGSGFDVISVGKINDIFDGEGIVESHKSKSNEDGMNITIDLLKKDFTGLCFVNLVDFDALWGHRRDPIGYAKELEQFDVQLKTFIHGMKQDDLLMITADHGNDPIHHGTDHTRENVPLLMYSPSHTGSGLLSSNSFSSVGMTIADNFNVSKPDYGYSYLSELK